jgi:hypothetical protein
VLVINLTTPRTLVIAIPPAVRLGADRPVE